jgi:hypothetical protein
MYYVYYIYTIAPVVILGPSRCSQRTFVTTAFQRFNGILLLEPAAVGTSPGKWIVKIKMGGPSLKEASSSEGHSNYA